MDLVKQARLTELEVSGAYMAGNLFEKSERELIAEAQLLKALQVMGKWLDGFKLVGYNPFGPRWGMGWSGCIDRIKTDLQEQINLITGSLSKGDIV